MIIMKCKTYLVLVFLLSKNTLMNKIPRPYIILYSA